MSRDLKYEKENIELRRGTVLELDAQGFSQHDIATKLNVSIGIVNSDLKYIREQARENIRLYIHDKLPHEYNRCLAGLSSILKESWTISSSTEDNREKIQALSLAKECYNAKLDLLTNVTVVEDVIKFVNKDKGKQKNVIDDSDQTAQFDTNNVLEPSPLEEEPIQEPSEEDAS